MVILHVQLFGGRQLIRRNDSSVALQPAIQEFLAFLLLNRHRQFHRSLLTGHFWGGANEHQARRCLSTALWRLRRELEPDGTPQGTFILARESGEIGFNCQSSYWLDVSSFEEKVTFGLRHSPTEMNPDEVEALREATALYRGDLLEGLYSDWVLIHRERLRSQYVKCLNQLMRYHRARHEYDQSLTYGEQILQIDPLRETTHREMMHLYASKGERSRAIQQYQRCHQTLLQELGIQPMTETQALYHRLFSSSTEDTGAVNAAAQPDLAPVASSRPSSLPPRIRRRPADLQQALQQLEQALIGLEEARAQVHQAVHIVNGFVGPGHGVNT